MNPAIRDKWVRYDECGTPGRHDGPVLTVRGFVVPDADLTWRFSRSSGPGGQHVNTTDTRVRLTYDLAGSDAFPE